VGGGGGGVVGGTNITVDITTTLLEEGSVGGGGVVGGTNITVDITTTLAPTTAVPGPTAVPVPIPLPVSISITTSPSAAPTTGPYTYPYIDNATMLALQEEFNSTVVTMPQLNTTTTTTTTAITNTISTSNTTAATTNVSSSSSSCRRIDVGRTCYDTSYSIDFETSSMNCAPDINNTTFQEYDVIALYSYNNSENNDDGVDDTNGDDWYSNTVVPTESRQDAFMNSVTSTTDSVVGTTKPLQESLYWATSCTLPECDGVISSPGIIYYRNLYPTKMMSPTESQLTWPIAGGSFLQLVWVRVDATGTALILAESRPFVVADRCL